jgi:hypothetical protein
MDQFVAITPVERPRDEAVLAVEAGHNRLLGALPDDESRPAIEPSSLASCPGHLRA